MLQLASFSVVVFSYFGNGHSVILKDFSYFNFIQPYKRRVKAIHKLYAGLAPAVRKVCPGCNYAFIYKLPDLSHLYIFGTAVAIGTMIHQSSLFILAGNEKKPQSHLS